jgi:hypothetical protein
LRYKRGVWASYERDEIICFSSLDELSLSFLLPPPDLALTHTCTQTSATRTTYTHHRDLGPSSLSRPFVPYYKSVLMTWATRTGRRVLLFGGPNQYKSWCPLSHTIRGLACNPRNLLAGGYRTLTSSFWCLLSTWHLLRTRQTTHQQYWGFLSTTQLPIQEYLPLEGCHGMPQSSLPCASAPLSDDLLDAPSGLPALLYRDNNLKRFAIVS